MPATGGPQALRAVGLDWGLQKVSGASRPRGLLEGLLGGVLGGSGGLLEGLGVCLRSWGCQKDLKETLSRSPDPTRHPRGDLA